MTEAKKLKQGIRARSAKTGESYTAARRQVLEARQKRKPQRTEATPVTPPRPVAARSGLSEEPVVAKTGHGFDHWFTVLDGFGAAARGHTAAARHLAVEHGVTGWYSQGITVAYERARGPRATGTSVVAANTRLRDAAQVAERRSQWRAALDALKTHLAR